MVSVEWKTPFADKLYPAVRLFSSDETAGAVNVVVLKEYPVFLVRFELAVSYKSHYEGMVPETFPKPDLAPQKSCYIVANSPWKTEFREVSSFTEWSFGRPFDDLRHYVILGGDNVVEVLALEPTIKQINSPQMLAELKV